MGENVSWKAKNNSIKGVFGTKEHKKPIVKLDSQRGHIKKPHLHPISGGIRHHPELRSRKNRITLLSVNTLRPTGRQRLSRGPHGLAGLVR